MFLKADGKSIIQPLVPFSFFVSLYLLPVLAPCQCSTQVLQKGGRTCPSPSLLPPALSIYTASVSTQRQSSFHLLPPILGSVVHITSFCIFHNLLFYFNYLCCILFELAWQVDYPSHHSSCQGAAIFVSYNTITPWTSPPLAQSWAIIVNSLLCLSL